MVTLEDLSRMAMVEIDSETAFPMTQRDGWGKMALLLAASAAVCGVVVGLKQAAAGEDRDRAVPINR